MRASACWLQFTEGLLNDERLLQNIAYIFTRNVALRQNRVSPDLIPVLSIANLTCITYVEMQGY